MSLKRYLKEYRLYDKSDRNFYSFQQAVRNNLTELSHLSADERKKFIKILSNHCNKNYFLFTSQEIESILAN